MFKVALLLLLAPVTACYAFVLHSPSHRTNNLPLNGVKNLIVRRLSKDCESFSSVEDEALEKTRKQLEILKGISTVSTYGGDEANEEKEKLYQDLVKRPANSLKEHLRNLKLPTKGRKPDLARRLVDYFIRQADNQDDEDGEEDDKFDLDTIQQCDLHEEILKECNDPIKTFGSMTLSTAAAQILTNAGFTTPTSIQSIALPILTEKKESIVIHAETGSGKTIAYLLPITEKLWKEQAFDTELSKSFALILTPTRELAIQVAGVATALSPPNTVRLITHPSNLLRANYEEKEKSESTHGGRKDLCTNNEFGTKLIVGSARSIMTSLFGDEKMPSSPTSKPEAKLFLKNVEYLVLDEVDRLLDVKKIRGKTSKFYKKHEKPAALIASSVSRLSLGRVQIVAASATIGRPLKRELSRVLGYHPSECPQTIRAQESQDKDSSSRVISIPKTLKHYIMACDADTSGSLLTSAAFLIKELSKIGGTDKKVLLVVTNDCGIQLNDAIGALGHFGITPEPKLLLDFMNADGTDSLIDAYRDISETSGLGEKSISKKSSIDKSSGYLLVTGENSVRGMHLNDLDIVAIVGRTKGPDEYTHVAGRAGRAGRKGKVVNIIRLEHMSSFTGLQSMLGIDFEPIDQNKVSSLL